MCPRKKIIIKIKKKEKQIISDPGVLELVVSCRRAKHFSVEFKFLQNGKKSHGMAANCRNSTRKRGDSCIVRFKKLAKKSETSLAVLQESYSLLHSTTKQVQSFILIKTKNAATELTLLFFVKL